MNRKMAIGFLVLYFGLGTALVSAAEAMDQAKAANPMMDPAMMEKMKQLGSPGEQHKVLDTLAGKCKHTMKWWMAPDAPPEESSGNSEKTWILGGRYLKDETKGQAMGQPFEGLGLTGYDNVKGEYTYVWLDNMSTGIMSSTSQYDPATQTFSEKGSFSCPVTGEKNKTFRAVTKIIDNDHFTYTMYSTGMQKDGSPEFKSMEIMYTRVQ